MISCGRHTLPKYVAKLGLLYRRFYRYSSPNNICLFHQAPPRVFFGCLGPFTKERHRSYRRGAKICSKSLPKVLECQLLIFWYNPIFHPCVLEGVMLNFDTCTRSTVSPHAPKLTRHVPFSSRSVHPKIIIPHSPQCLSSFFPSTIATWNSLLSDTASAPSITSFKSALKTLTC